MIRTILTAAALAALTGCMTTAERAAIMQAEVDEMVAVYGPACEKLGFQSGTDAWRNCVLGLSAQKSRERYLAYPRSATCWGQRGFYSCTGF
jgi:hypothetical protein